MWQGLLVPSKDSAQKHQLTCHLFCFLIA
uniref:Uncharacterized protein n=1 Tax=Arundo donax TaxID=35708 RepID=A0A0A9EP42_ARUDO